MEGVYISRWYAGGRLAFADLCVCGALSCLLFSTHCLLRLLLDWGCLGRGGRVPGYRLFLPCSFTVLFCTYGRGVFL